MSPATMRMGVGLVASAARRPALSSVNAAAALREGLLDRTFDRARRIGGDDDRVADALRLVEQHGLGGRSAPRPAHHREALQLDGRGEVGEERRHLADVVRQPAAGACCRELRSAAAQSALHRNTQAAFGRLSIQLREGSALLREGGWGFAKNAETRFRKEPSRSARDRSVWGMRDGLFRKDRSGSRWRGGIRNEAPPRMTRRRTLGYREPVSERDVSGEVLPSRIALLPRGSPL